MQQEYNKHKCPLLRYNLIRTIFMIYKGRIMPARQVKNIYNITLG